MCEEITVGYSHFVFCFVFGFFEFCFCFLLLVFVYGCPVSALLTFVQNQLTLSGSESLLPSDCLWSVGLLLGLWPVANGFGEENCAVNFKDR